tara:strand:+ start:865 stop:1353 length:489 start_codon:yes stop_codon:yes gene_type:complete
MSQKRDPSDVSLSSYIMIIATWPGDSNDDIDLYVKDPAGGIVFFRNKDNNLMHLDRDDVGNNEDLSAEEKPDNREIVTIRKKVEGEFIVNAHTYSKYSEDLLPVSIQIIKISPRYEIHNSVFFFEEANEEQTICRFTVDHRGKIKNVSHAPVELARPILVGP